MKSSETEKKKIIKKQLINSLSELCAVKCISPETPPEKWLSTREVADQCQLGIYQARYFLLQLAEENLVVTTSGSVNNALRWRITDHSCYPTSE
jgi:ribosomal protein S25